MKTINEDGQREKLLAQLLAEKGIQRQSNQIIETRDHKPYYEQSFSQQRMWFLDRLHPGSSAYNLCYAIELTGSFNVNSLERVLNELISRYEILRTSFDEVEGVPVQRIRQQLQISIESVNIQTLTAKERQKEITQAIEAEASCPFDLKQEPLIRVKVMEVKGDVTIVMLSLHHIVSDEWSMRMLMEEMALIYSSLEKGEQVPEQVPALQYADYSEWQLGMLRNGKFDQQLDYWRTQLEGVEQLELPIDQLDFEGRLDSGASVSIDLSDGVTQKINMLAESLGVTSFMLCLSVYTILLSRYSGQDDILLGTPVWGRDRSELERVLGCFINTVALRAQLGDDPSFSELIERIRQVVLNAFSNQDIPFERVVEALGIERNSTDTPLVRTIFSLINTGSDQLALGDLVIEEIDIPLKTSKFDLGMTIVESDSQFSVHMEYNNNIFRRSTIENMLHHYTNILENCLALPEAPISKAEFFSEQEGETVKKWSLPEFGANTGIDFRAKIEHLGRDMPKQVALVCGGESISYRELNQSANQMAAYLKSLKILPGSLIGVGMTRSIESVTCCLAVLKAGAAFLPLDLSNPSSRINKILEDANVHTVLTNLNDGEKIEKKFECIDISQKVEDIAKQSNSNPDISGSDGDLAYVIYTSGSSGQPRGVEVSYGALNNLANWTIRAFELGINDRSTQLASAGFDASVWELWPFLSAGATVYIIPDSLKSEPKKLVEFIELEKVTVCFMPTPLAELCLERAWDEKTALRVMLTGGDTLHLDSDIRIPFKLYNNYGPTENTVVATFQEIDSDSGVTKPSIGRPIDGVEIYVLDEHMMRVPIGVAGELVLGGASLARGYRNPEHKQDKFIQLTVDGHERRAYRTGDRVRYLENGTLDYLGRIDNQVQIRGFRVELSEVENVAYQHPAVSRAVVVALTNESGKDYLVEYVEQNKDSVDQAELRSWHMERLPSYMVPRFVLVDKLPVNSNGKIDHSLLPKPELIREEIVLPQSDSEQIIAEIWMEVLGMEEVGITENFFDLGGHSLLAIKIASRLTVSFGSEIPLHAIFDEPTIQGLAAGLDEQRWTRARFQPPQLEPVERESPVERQFFAQSPSQRRLWFLEQFNPSENVYGINDLYQIDGEINVAALRMAFNDLVDRHEILRTTFTIDDVGNFVQVVSDQSPDVFTLTNLEILEADAREDKAKVLIMSESERPFDLLRGPMLRIMLLRFSETFHLLLISKHHIVTDAWSESIFIDELSSIYRAEVNNVEPNLAPLPIQYADYANWLDDWLQFGVLEEMLFYWREHLRDAPPELALKTDHPRLKHQRSNGGVVHFKIDVNLSNELKLLARHLNVTLFMALLTLFKVLLARYSSQSDIVVGVPVANRSERTLENLIGFFVNTLAIRTKIEDDPSFNQLATKVCKNLLDGFEQQDLPFERLVEELAPEERWRKAPVFQVLFVLQNEPVKNLELEGTSISKMDLLPHRSKFDLTLSMSETDEETIGALEFNADLFEQETIERMVGHFQEVISSVVESPDLPLSQINMLPSHEQKELMIWSSGRSVQTIEGDVCSWIEKHAKNSPSACAVCDADGELSYAELDRKANQLARYLRLSGVEPGSVVAVGMERSTDMLVSFLSIIKAGAAYLPLDISNPPERVRSVLASGDVTVILVNSSSKEVFEEIDPNHICISSNAKAIAEQKDSQLPRNLSPEDLAYVMFTSGSTGAPKGVEVPHRALANLISWQQRILQVTPQDRFSQLAGAASDATIMEWWVALSSGASVHVVDNSSRLFASELLSWFAKHRITIAFIPTLMAEKTIAEKWSEDVVLRFLQTGGETLKQRPSKDAAYTLLNEYGPTEGCVVSTYATISNAQTNVGIPSIGKPIDGVEVYVLDSSMALVPIGVAGELYIGGSCLAKGYRNNPKLTDEKFVPNPFSTEQNERLYRTGDQVRYRYDGELEFIGRVDDQIKIRGYRVELNEVYCIVAEHKLVNEVYVTSDEDSYANKSIVAYVTMKDDVSSVEPVDSETLIDQLKELIGKSLPEYMVPTSITVLLEMPKTLNGKVDREKLPKPNINVLSAHDGEIVLARNDIEKGVSEIWSTLLSYKPVSIHHDFFTVGGHSLLAISLKSEIFKTFGVNIELAELFKKGTVEYLGLHIKELMTQGLENVSEVAEEWGVGASSLEPTDGIMGRVRNLVDRGKGELAQIGSNSIEQAKNVLVPMVSGGTKAPVFFIHPIGGDVICYGQISQGLSDAHPVYGLRTPGENLKNEAFDIKIIAQRYISYIKSVQASGPYYLSGWSLGGIIAFEMACQLTTNGDQVAMLALLDSYPSNNRVKISNSSDKRILSELVNDFLKVNGKSVDVDWLEDDLTNSADNHVVIDDDLIKDAFDVLQVAEAVPDDMTLELFNEEWHSFKAFYRGWEQYQPSEYKGHVSLILASHSLSKNENALSTAWREVARGGLNIEVVQGDHYSIMRGDTSEVIADLISGLIRESVVH